MKTPIRLVLAATFLSSLPLSARAQDRVALVVGNNLYPDDGNFPSLDNCAGDATLIKATLASLGFRVFHAENATRSEMDAILTDFENAIPRGGTAVFYFAGHGIEFNGKNYLMGSNAKLQARSRLGEESMDAETFASAMLVAGAKSSFVFLDCCREVPKDVEWLTRGVKKRGLAELNIDGDVIIAYAAKPGQAALDGHDGNSPYARALAKWLPSGMKHGDLFDQVRLEVHQTTGGAQRTWESGSFLEPFFFKPAEDGVTASVATMPFVPVSLPSSVTSGAPLTRFIEAFDAFEQALVAKDVETHDKEWVAYLLQGYGAIPTEGLPEDLRKAYLEIFTPLREVQDVLSTLPGDFSPANAEDKEWRVRAEQADPGLSKKIDRVIVLRTQFRGKGEELYALLAKYRGTIPTDAAARTMPAATTSTPATSSEAVARFIEALEAAEKTMFSTEPSPSAKANLARILSGFESIPTAGIPEGLLKTFVGFVDTIREEHKILATLPDDFNLEVSQDKTWRVRAEQTDPELINKIDQVFKLEQESKRLSEELTALLAKYSDTKPMSPAARSTPD